MSMLLTPYGPHTMDNFEPLRLGTVEEILNLRTIDSKGCMMRPMYFFVLLELMISMGPSLCYCGMRESDRHTGSTGLPLRSRT